MNTENMCGGWYAPYRHSVTLQARSKRQPPACYRALVLYYRSTYTASKGNYATGYSEYTKEYS